MTKPVIVPPETKTEYVSVPPRELVTTSTNALTFLAELVPLPGWSQDTERKLVEVIRGLKKALEASRGK